jgi:hypothetical protein
MINVTGIFASQFEAECAVRKLQTVGIENSQINLLSPANVPGEPASVSTTEAEQPGVGKAFGGLVGGALGAAGGMHLGATAASLFLPGVGPVIAVGLAGAALLGAGGALGGAAVGEHMEVSTDLGIPRDELFVYEDALRKGRTVLLLQVGSDEEKQKVSQALESCGAESLNAAREAWWIGLRDAEAERYAFEGGDFSSDESVYRLGFEAAQRWELRGKSYSAGLESLQDRYSSDVCNRAAFRRGYERGQAYRQSLGNSSRREDADNKPLASHYSHGKD